MKQTFAIDMNQPGSVLKDFHTLIDFIGLDGELVSKKQLVFSTKSLLELNQQMSKPLAQDKKRPQQTTFPHIAVIYQCAHLLGFFHYIDEGTRKRINLNLAMIENWNKLNLTEQYFTLFEKWVYGDLEDYRSSPPIKNLWQFKQGCLKKTKEEYQRIFKDEYQIAELLAGLELFGLITIDHTKPDVGGGWKIKGLTLTQTGQFIFRVLEVDDKEAIFNRAYLRETGDSLFDDFQDYFPQLKKRYVVTKSKNSNRTGIYFFKVSLEGAWRRVAVRHQATLDDLADVILTAFDFDSDHLYSFRFLDTAGLKREYLHPMAMDAEAFSDEITLAELPLSLKGSMKFIFDFGDWWEFNVLLEKVEEDYPLADDKIAKLVTEKGEAPEQYPDWDEE